ncbi:MAG: selenide, water dikinase SelD [Bacteroidales bacterium]
METIKLTQYSHGAGCGCKISPRDLHKILQHNRSSLFDPNLLVGNDTSDDAAVYNMGNGTAVISTTDFFLPIVDDPFTFGKIAATNAISDVYAMGGKPLMAIAILGWPINKISAEIAAQVMEGGREACRNAGIIIAGGHSIDNPEPLFGLAVTGIVELNKLKRNDTALAGCLLYLTKPLGVGILTTAQKAGKLKTEHSNIAPESMMILNDLGVKLSEIEGVKALTDVTGFGLLGHLLEICEGSGLSAVVDYNKIPVFKEIQEYIDADCIPGGTHRNWSSYGEKIKIPDEKLKYVLCDPQTSGGLLIAVDKNSASIVENLLKSRNMPYEPFGVLIDKSKYAIEVNQE